MVYLQKYIFYYGYVKQTNNMTNVTNKVIIMMLIFMMTLRKLKSNGNTHKDGCKLPMLDVT